MTPLLTAIGRDIATELANAVFVVADPADEHLLHCIGVRGALHVPHAHLLGLLIGMQATDVVLCAGTDPRLATWLSVELPHVRTRTLPIDSPVLAMGVREMPEMWAEVEALRERWLALAGDHSRCADLDHDPRADVPAPPTTTVVIRRAGR